MGLLSSNIRVILMTDEEWEAQLDEVFGFSKTIEYRWANEDCAHGLPHPDELEYLGYEKVQQHPNFPKSWLMVRRVNNVN